MDYSPRADSLARLGEPAGGGPSHRVPIIRCGSDPNSAELAQKFEESWIRYFGLPVFVLADPAPENVGKAFEELLNYYDIRIHIVAG